LADFFPNWNFREVFSVHIQYYSPEGTATLRWAGGRAAPRLAWQLTQKDGCAQRTGAHARPKPTSILYLFSVQHFTDLLMTKRLQTLQSVDDAIGRTFVGLAFLSK
jgi:hypothetical protein